MIGYRVSRAELEALAERESPGWVADAALRTGTFVAARAYAEETPSWSKIKAVFMRLQRDKCIYCERRLPSEMYGKIEHDIEHFRPKRSVKTWTSPALKDAGVTITAVPAVGAGYYALPYDVLNYSTACKTCNSTLKSDRFPIAGGYDFDGTSPSGLLAKEEPLLLYPIGDFDIDPESAIEFHGLSPRAKTGIPKALRDRALTTIEFFRLDDPDRKELVLGRANIVLILHSRLERLAAGPDEEAQKVVDACCAPRTEHTNCARSFVRLYGRDRDEANTLAKAAADFFASTSA